MISRKEAGVSVERNESDIRIVLDLDPLVVGVYFDMGIEQWDLVDPHLLISSPVHRPSSSNSPAGLIRETRQKQVKCVDRGD